MQRSCFSKALREPGGVLHASFQGIRSCVTTSSAPHAHKLFQLASSKPADPLPLPKAIAPENSSQNSSVELHSPVFSLNQRQAWVHQSLNTYTTHDRADSVPTSLLCKDLACMPADRRGFTLHLWTIEGVAVWKPRLVSKHNFMDRIARSKHGRLAGWHSSVPVYFIELIKTINGVAGVRLQMQVGVLEFWRALVHSYSTHRRSRHTNPNHDSPPIQP